MAVTPTDDASARTSKRRRTGVTWLDRAVAARATGPDRAKRFLDALYDAFNAACAASESWGLHGRLGALWITNSVDTDGPSAWSFLDAANPAHAAVAVPRGSCAPDVAEMDSESRAWARSAVRTVFACIRRLPPAWFATIETFRAWIVHDRTMQLSGRYCPPRATWDPMRELTIVASLTQFKHGPSGTSARVTERVDLARIQTHARCICVLEDPLREIYDQLTYDQAYIYSQISTDVIEDVLKGYIL